MNQSSITLDAFNKGVSFQTYQNAMTKYKQQMVNQYQAMQLTESIKTEFATVVKQTGVAFVLVLTEDFCPDSVLNLPIVMHLVNAVPTLQLSIVYRSDYEDIALEYPAEDGYNHIPTVIFMKKDGTVVGVWHERPAAAHTFLAAYKKANPHPPKKLEGGVTNPDFKHWLAKRFSIQRKKYQDELWQETANELIDLLKKSVSN